MRICGNAMTLRGFASLLFLFISTTFVLASKTAQASGLEQLQAFYRDIQSLRGEFQQTVMDARQKVSEKASGIFMLQRPGKFRWDYRTPYPQLIVTDGGKVWIYDQELEQVTVKDLGSTIGDMPAQLLSRGEVLARNFIINDLGTADGREQVELTPRDKDSGFEKIRLTFAQQELRSMELVDRFGQTTYLQFSHLERNPKLAPELFHFKPPTGVDVVGE